MWFFSRQRKKEEALKEKAITKLHSETIKKNQKAQKEIEKVNKLLEDHPDDIAALIYAATGGVERDKK